ncbi:MAG: hypothetical protein CLLPBCKN_001400 [Chroococcidiopsis cubana SAG 39.79]|jgi:uncharacterized protein YybS (DUF2232 family)|uniref:DUF2232 domain-containing protein n=3 Tax=Chroococcidiopsis TaxID=54298 RepID=K9U1X6_CHRTP|nr:MULTISPECIES: DUF2232 domain-containing protein [Chroococcidiopsis]MBD2306923.1 DUF2232 domain-containing protein [Chroococcidiopsis sp. [FACHB-1243]]MBE9017529.1 DUF2232 domain-containing protein [Chroococcidiopsidales cyanobacterium LEGE 13417]PSB49049.1 DUF2232 domain-containing protein [Cyanosarcina cf. burmensis CCALA 770]AFY88431.1 Protein of unknown function DUF2232, membrane [Chroococcidiopsis thermalis PCC 7203]MDZ4872012.1 hypothetical protein [Chroococcidiopsis cubana SAG 39.79]
MSDPHSFQENPSSDLTTSQQSERSPGKSAPPLAMVETAFLASTASLIYFINFYFPLGPLLRIFFAIPVAIVYLRWSARAGWMAAGVSGLLLAVLMGPIPSLLYVMPYGVMGVLLGAAWRRRSPWIVSVALGTLLGAIGFFFRFWLMSIWSGRDLWVYLIVEVTELAEWIFDKLGLLLQPSMLVIQVLALALVLVSNLVYLFVVHLVAWLLLDRLGNPIPRPPRWVQVLMDYE